jgi:hypothetical protein
MAQAVSHRPLTAEAQYEPGSVHVVCGGQSDTRTGFTPNSSFFPCQYHSTGPPYSYIIWGGGIGPLVAAVQKHNLTPRT